MIYAPLSRFVVVEKNYLFSGKGGGSLKSEKFFAKKRNIVFRNEGGGWGQRRFGSFPKIHPKLCSETSLIREGSKYIKQKTDAITLPIFWKIHSQKIPFWKTHKKDTHSKNNLE